MVLKHAEPPPMEFFKFESDVISDGTQAIVTSWKYSEAFESDVISDGTQALGCRFKF